MAAAEGEAIYASPTEYVSHHLTNLTFGQIDGHWGFAHSPEEAGEMGFWAINVDSMLMSVILGALILLAINIGLTLICYFLLKSGWKIKS
jgi:F-type H+-transporting ATPase subunit a